MKNKKEYSKKYYLKNKEELDKKSKEYNIKNKESISKNKKQYYKENKEKILEKKKIYRLKNKEKIKIQRKKYREENKDKIAKQKYEYQKRYLSTSIGKLNHNIRQAIRRSLIESGYTKKYKSEEILGCTIEVFKVYIESQFEDWMTWENKGKYNGEANFGWDLDHITPLSSAENESNIIELNHYTNIQPLCSKYNRDIKKDNVI